LKNKERLLASPNLRLMFKEQFVSPLILRHLTYNTISVNLFKRHSMTSDFVIKSSHLQEAEFILLEVMDCCLVIYQPYRPLVQLASVSIFQATLY
jgi:hypothetical protein